MTASSPASASAPARAVGPFVAAVALLAALGVAAGGLLLARAGVGAAEAGLALALAAGVFVVQQASIPFDWRGQRLTVSIEEGVLFLALVTIHPAFLPPALLVACGLTQAIARRPAIKAAFNVGTYTLAAAAAAALFLLLEGAGVAPLLAAFPAVAVYSLGSNALVACLFARLGGEPAWRVFAARFILPAALQFAFGASVGVVMAGLWAHHPAATVAVLPFVLLAKGYVTLTARADRELEVHRRVAAIAHALVGKPDAPPVVEHVLESCGSLFLAGEACLVLRDGSGAERAWSRRFEGGPAPGTQVLSIPIPSREGAPMGALSIRPRHARDYGALERELLNIVAGQASAALSNAAALERILDLKNLHEGIVQNVPAGVMRLDGEGRVVQANPALLAMLDDAPDPTGQPVLAWTPFAVHPRLCEELQGLLEGRAFYDVELSTGARVLNVSGVPLPRGPGEHGVSTGGVLLASDVTSRRQAEEALRRQMLTKPIVRRIVLDLVGRVGATPRAIAEVGRSLAGEVQDARTPEDLAHAFRTMGLGDLRLEKLQGETYTFVADDLLERRRRSLQPTCHLALGYVEGIVSALHDGRPALGSEIRCQSQGHPRCVFVAKPREAPAPAAKAPARRAG